MSTEIDLNAEIRNLKASYNAQLARNAAISKDVEALEDALKYVRKAKGHAEQVKETLQKGKPSDSWKGTSKKNYETAREGDLKKKASSFYDGITALEEDVKGKIEDLKKEYSYIVAAMDWINTQLGSAERELKELISGQEKA